MEMHLTFQMVQICGAGNTQFCLQGSKQSRKSDIFAMRPKCLPPTLHLYLTTRCTKHFQVCIYHQSPQKHGAPLLLQALLQIRIISAKPHSFSLSSWRAGMNVIKAWGWRGSEKWEIIEKSLNARLLFPLNPLSGSFMVAIGKVHAEDATGTLPCSSNWVPPVTVACNWVPTLYWKPLLEPGQTQLLCSCQVPAQSWSTTLEEESFSGIFIP